MRQKSLNMRFHACSRRTCCATDAWLASPSRTKHMTEKKQTAAGTYIPGLGRRKEAVAQVRLFVNGSGKITVNEREMKEYFPVYTLQQAVLAPFVATGTEGKYDV